MFLLSIEFGKSLVNKHGLQQVSDIHLVSHQKEVR